MAISLSGYLCVGIYFAAITKLAVGNIYAQQNIRFTKPVYVGDTVTAEVTTLEKLEKKRMLRLATKCYNQKDEVVLDGEALLYIQK